MSKRPYRRVLLKLSGELLAKFDLLTSVLRQLITAHRNGTSLLLVPGGGNIVRGRDVRTPDRLKADQSGMLATVINGIRLTGLLEASIPVRHLAAFPVSSFVEPYSVRAALLALQRHELLVLSGGTGNPFFSTDSAAALRAAELNVDLLMKGTRVRGAFSADPEAHPDALFYRRLTYEEALAKHLQIMDATAFALCMDRSIPIVVFDIARPRVITDLIAGKRIGSLIC